MLVNEEDSFIISVRLSIFILFYLSVWSYENSLFYWSSGVFESITHEIRLMIEHILYEKQFKPFMHNMSSN